MSQRSFYLQLTILSGATAVALFFYHQIPRFQSHSTLSWVSLAFFIGLTIIMYYSGVRAAASTNKHNFTNVVMGFTIVKMMVAILIVLAYYKLAEPESKLFILPFFGIYFIYTIFETYLMTRLGKMHT